jgi:N-alpha-acetyl-L-2,4-diaminobutyrate deacetylase
MSDSSIGCSIELGAPGRQAGFLRVPRSDNTSGWAGTMVPIVSVRGGDGPTALVLAGNHGDEYEGQVAAMKLARELRPHEVEGTVIIIPCLSVDASRAGTRLWPSGANFNRSFPGSPAGTPPEQLADFLTRELFPRADTIIDIHSGGESSRFTPVSHMHVVSDREQRARMLAAGLAWNTEFFFLYVDVAGTGLLPVEAETQGKTVVTTELAGGGNVSAATHAIAASGLANVLRHEGVLAGAAQTRESLGLPPVVVIDSRDPDNYIPAPESGIMEILVEPGERVAADQPVARIHFLERIEREATVVTAPNPGIVAAVRGISNVLQGEVVAVVGTPCTPADVLAD